MTLDDIVRRTNDVVGATVGLIALSPVMAVTAVAVYVSDPGSIIYSQRRFGKDGEPFTMYKFRTMKEGTPEMSKEKLEGDPYIPIGKFLRRHKLDELPQLYNILRGEMTFVGPRPALVDAPEDDELSGPPLQRAREALGLHKLKPGLTGHQQIEGDQATMEGILVYDLQHFSRKSVFDDFSIVLRTLKFLADRAF